MENLIVELAHHHLAGSLWLPQQTPTAIVVMIPGSGPSDRHNDVLFPPIRQALLEAGIAVSSFDKRGVGSSSGSWLTAGILEQALDIAAIIATLRGDARLRHLPIGVFGHSQGGWVALEVAARDSSLAFVVTNSGPGVSPAEQERFAARSGLLRHHVDFKTVSRCMDAFDTMFSMVRGAKKFDAFEAYLGDPTVKPLFELLERHAFVPTDEALWDLLAMIADYQPRAALERLEMPLLALFGGADTAVPVQRSVAVHHEALMHNREATVRVFEGAGHRLMLGDDFALGYLEMLKNWIVARTLGRLS
jgi:uncharacterized protein